MKTVATLLVLFLIAPSTMLNAINDSTHRDTLHIHVCKCELVVSGNERWKSSAWDTFKIGEPQINFGISLSSGCRNWDIFSYELVYISGGIGLTRETSGSFLSIDTSVLRQMKKGDKLIIQNITIENIIGMRRRIKGKNIIIE